MKLTYSKVLITTGFILLVLTFAQTAAANVEIKLVEPEKFRDIELTNRTNKRSIESLTKDMNKLFNRLASKYISEDKKLFIEITDVDLAGRIEHMVGPNSEDLRIIRDNDSFKLSFNYKLMDKDGKVIKQGEAKLRNFLTHTPDMRLKPNRTTTAHFERELKKWFKKELKES